jgi:hypothetical protein
LCEGHFDTDADGPARFDRAVESGLRIEASLNVAESGAGRAVEEDAIEGVADAPAYRCEPLALRLARYRRYYDRRNGSAGRPGIAAQIGPIAVALDAEDVLGYLVIDASDTVFDYCAVTLLTLSPRTMHQLRRIEVGGGC